MRKWLLAAAAAAIFVAPSAAMAQAPIVIKFSHVVAPNTPKGKGADKFKELAEHFRGKPVSLDAMKSRPLPPPPARYQQELTANWNALENGRPPQDIDPLR